MKESAQKATVVDPVNHTGKFPRDFGRYRLIRLLASGMAQVYEAEQASPKRRVALKIPRGGLLLTEEARKRFLREVALAANTDHASIVPILDTGEVDGTPYFTMPFVEGKACDRYLKENQAQLAETLAFYQQLCAVVSALHQKGLIHRDLKPSNILVDSHGSIRLLDFGLAKVAHEASEVSMAPTVMGTLDYMAPEQAGAKDGKIGPATDVYAIGMMLYRSVAGESPYPSFKDLPTQLRWIAEAPPKPPSKLNRDIPPALEQLILECLDKDPAQRPQDAASLGARIAGLDTTRTTTASVRSRAPFWIGAGALLLAGASATAYFGWPRGATETGAAQSSFADRTPETSSPLKKPFDHTRYSLAQIQTATGTERTTAPNNSPVPSTYWTLYNQLKNELRNNFERRRQAAWIFALSAGSRPRDVEIRQGDQSQRLRLQSDQVSVLYLETDEPAELHYSGNRQSLDLQAGEVGFTFLQ